MLLARMLANAQSFEAGRLGRKTRSSPSRVPPEPLAKRSKTMPSVLAKTGTLARTRVGWSVDHHALLWAPAPVSSATTPIQASGTASIKLDDLPTPCLANIAAALAHVWTRASTMALVCKEFSQAFDVAHELGAAKSDALPGMAGATLQPDDVLGTDNHKHPTVWNHLLTLRQKCEADQATWICSTTRAAALTTSINHWLTDIEVDSYLGIYFPNAIHLTTPVDIAFIPSIMMGGECDILGTSYCPWYESDRAVHLWYNDHKSPHAWAALTSLLTSRLLLFPIARNRHWILLVRQNRGKRGRPVWYALDSLRGSGGLESTEAARVEIEMWLRNAWERLRTEHASISPEMTEPETSKPDVSYLECAQQPDGSSCGVHLLCFARAIAQGAMLTPRISVSDWRKHIAMNIFLA